LRRNHLSSRWIDTTSYWCWSPLGINWLSCLVSLNLKLLLSLFWRRSLLFYRFIHYFNILVTNWSLTIGTFSSETIIDNKSWLIDIQMMTRRNLLLLYLLILILVVWLGYLWCLLCTNRTLNTWRIFLSWNTSLFELFVFFSNLFIKTLLSRG
jgi:hypothetical protein